MEIKIRYVVKDPVGKITMKSFMLKEVEDGLLNYWLAGFQDSDIKIISRDLFTGTQDKNDKDIYEGDIVKIPEDWDEYGFNAGEKYEVYFAFGGFRLKPKYQKDAKGFYLEDDGLEIIGSRHQNPELCKE